MLELNHSSGWFKKGAKGEVCHMKDQADDECQVESRTHILFRLRTVFLGKLMNTRQTWFKDELYVVGDENDIDDHLDDKVYLKPSYTLGP